MKAVLIICVLILVSCTASIDKSNQTPLRKNIPINSFKMVGRVIKVLDNQFSENENSPCSKVPCNVLIKIDSLQGFGRSSIHSAKVNDTINVSFAFTTKPSQKLFPKLKYNLVPVKVGDEIKAYVYTNESSNQNIYYSIRNYNIK